MIMKRVEDVTLSDFFTPKLMNQVTNFRNFEAFLVASGFGAKTAEEFDELTNADARDEFVAANSQFSSWSKMVKYFRDSYFGF